MSKGKHTSTRTTSTPFQEWASIWLAKRHLTSDYHRVPKDQLTGCDWHSLARRHDHMHLVDEGGAIRHCGWTPAVARPVLTLILLYSLLTIIGPVGLVPPVGLIAVLTGWLMTGSVVMGLVWAVAASLLVFVVLVVYWSVEAIRLMLIPPSLKRLDVWRARYVNGESYDDGYDGGWGPFTFLWPGRTGEWG